jgi:hypothetical protein
MDAHNLECLCSEDYWEHPVIRRWARESEELRFHPHDLDHWSSGSDYAVKRELAKLYQSYKNTAARIKELEFRRTKRAAILSPVRRLPGEILGMIFLQIGQSFDHANDIIGARLVCRKWDAVAVTTPGLWTDVAILPADEQSMWPREVMTAWVARSKTLPLRVSICTLGTWDQEELLHNLQPLLRAMRRWIEFRFDGPDASLLPRIFNTFICSKNLRSLREISLFSNKCIHGVMFADPNYRTRRHTLRFPNLHKLTFGYLGTFEHLPGRFDAPNITSLTLNNLLISQVDLSCLTKDTPRVTDLVFEQVEFVVDGHDLQKLTFHHTELKNITLSRGCRYRDPHEGGTLGDLLHRMIAPGGNCLERLTIRASMPWPDLESRSPIWINAFSRPAVKQLVVVIPLSGVIYTEPNHFSRQVSRAASWFAFCATIRKITVLTESLKEYRPSKLRYEWPCLASRALLVALINYEAKVQELDLTRALVDSDEFGRYMLALKSRGSSQRITLGPYFKTWFDGFVLDQPAAMWKTVKAEDFWQILSSEE